MGIAATSAGTISIELMADMIRLEKDFAKAKRAMADMQVDVSSRAMSMGDSLEAMAGRAGRAGHAFEVAGRQVSASAGAQKAGMQQLGMQFGDMVTMYSLGAKPAQIFASQIGQVTQAIQLMSGGTSKVATFLGGPWGIGLAVAVTALAPFIARLFETKDALDDVGKAADSAMAKLRQSLAQASAVSDAATDSVQRLITAQAGLARANADIARTQADADALARTFGGGEAAQALYQRLGALERERIKQQDALKDAQNDLNEVQQAASVTIAMQTRNQERLNATEKETRTTKPKLTDAERAHIKAMKDAQREQEQAIEAAKSYAEQLEDQAAKFGKSTLEIQRMEVAAKAAAAPTAELADRIRAAGAALEEKQIAKAAEDFENMISQIYAEADLLPLVTFSKTLKRFIPKPPGMRK